MGASVNSSGLKPAHGTTCGTDLVRSSYSHQSTTGPLPPFLYTARCRWGSSTVSQVSCTTRGPTSRSLADRRSHHTLGGSTTWSSTEMIQGSSVVLMSVTSQGGRAAGGRGERRCARHPRGRRHHRRRWL